MNLRDLEYFIAVAKYKHFRIAAEHCFVSQPTLSGQIKKLEDELKVALFERTNRSVMLTKEGALLLPYAQQTLSSVKDLEEMAKSFGHPLSGQFSLGAIPTLAMYLFPKVVNEARQQMPNLVLTLVEAKTKDLLEQLKTGEVDAALVALPVVSDQWEVKELFDDPFYLAVPEGHDLVNKKEIQLTELENYPLLMLEEGHCLRGQALQACSLVSIKEHNFRATGLETLRQMVKSGTGITFIPEIAKISEEGIHYLPLSSSAMTRKVGLVFRKTSVHKEVIEKIVTTLSR